MADRGTALPSRMDPDELRRRAASIQWYHAMDLGHGVRTKGVFRADRALGRYRLPEDLTGKTVLDIGAWDGFFSFEAERRGAARVLAVDKHPWGGLNSKEGFELARAALGSSVEDRTVDVMALEPETVGTFDVVFCLGVLYHLPHPLAALERIRSVTGELLVLETAVDRLLTRVPAAAFYPRDSLKHDPSNWWGPNIRGVVELLRAAGFGDVEVVWKRSLPARLVHWPASIVRWRQWVGPLTALNRGRAVFHARP